MTTTGVAEAHARLAATAVEASLAVTAPTTRLRAKPYAYPILWHCSAECGEPFRLGQMYVQTSPDLKPLTRAHASCIAGRKGSDGDREAS
jgi:hypothetical protein